MNDGEIIEAELTAAHFDHFTKPSHFFDLGGFFDEFLDDIEGAMVSASSRVGMNFRECARRPVGPYRGVDQIEVPPIGSSRPDYREYKVDVQWSATGEAALGSMRTSMGRPPIGYILPTRTKSNTLGILPSCHFGTDFNCMDKILISPRY
jgi:hypothetical protein